MWQIAHIEFADDLDKKVALLGAVHGVEDILVLKSSSVVVPNARRLSVLC